jgi:hypothetical protein
MIVDVMPEWKEKFLELFENIRSRFIEGFQKSEY